MIGVNYFKSENAVFSKKWLVKRKAQRCDKQLSVSCLHDWHLRLALTVKRLQMFERCLHTHPHRNSIPQFSIYRNGKSTVTVFTCSSQGDARVEFQQNIVIVKLTFDLQNVLVFTLFTDFSWTFNADGSLRCEVWNLARPPGKAPVRIVLSCLVLGNRQRPKAEKDCCKLPLKNTEKDKEDKGTASSK